MDYLEIILKGYFDQDTRNYLPDYFFRKCKEVEKEGYSSGEFFEGCRRAVEKLEEDINKQFQKEKREIRLGLDLARRGLRGLENGVSESELRKFYDFADKVTPYKQQCEDSIKESEIALKEIKRDDFMVNLSQITNGKFRGDLEYSDVVFIKHNLPGAMKGEELTDFIKNAVGEVRAKYLKKVIDPFLNIGLSPVDSPEITKADAYKIVVHRAATLFECSEEEIEKGYNEYRYFLPFELLDNYYYDRKFHRFIPEMNKTTNEDNARILFFDIVKPQINKRLEEQLREGLPISEAISELRERYNSWGKGAKPGGYTTQKFCWEQYIEPYLFEIVNPLGFYEKTDEITMKKKLILYSLSGLTPDNVQEIYERNFIRWRYQNSSEVIVNSKKIEGLERILMLFPDENGNSNINECTVSDTTKNGFPLTEETFITEQLRQYEPLYENTKGSIINRENNLKLKIYIDCLQDKINKLWQTSESQQSESKSKRKPKEFHDTLGKACISKEAYESAKQFFIKNSLCDHDTFVYKDIKKGNLTVLASYIKNLHPKNYSCKLRNTEVQLIAQNSFGIKMGIDTVKRAPNDSKVKPEIPPFKV